MVVILCARCKYDEYDNAQPQGLPGVGLRSGRRGRWISVQGVRPLSSQTKSRSPSRRTVITTPYVNTRETAGGRRGRPSSHDAPPPRHSRSRWTIPLPARTPLAPASDRLTPRSHGDVVRGAQRSSVHTLYHCQRYYFERHAFGVVKCGRTIP